MKTEVDELQNQG